MGRHHYCCNHHHHHHYHITVSRRGGEEKRRVVEVQGGWMVTVWNEISTSMVVHEHEDQLRIARSVQQRYIRIENHVIARVEVIENLFTPSITSSLPLTSSPLSVMMMMMDDGWSLMIELPTHNLNRRIDSNFRPSFSVSNPWTYHRGQPRSHLNHNTQRLLWIYNRIYYQLCVSLSCF